jgi:hypothetical protein
MGLVSTVDFMLAAGNQEGVVTIFQIPKAPTPTTNGNDFERFVNNNLWDTNGSRSVCGFIIVLVIKKKSIMVFLLDSKIRRFRPP